MNRIANEKVAVQLGMLLIAAALFASTFGQNFTRTEVSQSPMFFPRIILCLWMVLNVISIAQAIRDQETTSDIASWTRIGIIVVATMIYANVIGAEGFFLPSVVFALIALPAFGIRNPLLVMLFAVAVPGALVLLFNHTLGMPLPTSRFTHLF